MEFSNKQNTEFSKLSKFDKSILLCELSELLIPYRGSLNLPKNATFGVEVEYDRVNRDDVDLFRQSQLSSYYPTYEKSLPRGGELTSTVLTDKASTWRELRKLCEFLRISGAEDSESVGSHIHIGVANTLGNNPKYWLNFIKVLTSYENIVFRFANGESVSPRATYNQFCYPIAIELYDNLMNMDKEELTMSDIERILPMEKFQSINFRNVKFEDLLNNKIQNTIEFRSPNGTYEEIIWQNNINFIIRFILSCCKEIDEEYMKYKINDVSYYYNNTHYFKVNIDDALELADLIFDNEIDKVYFLKQYFKDFEETRQEGLIYTKPFIKRR